MRSVTATRSWPAVWWQPRPMSSAVASTCTCTQRGVELQVKRLFVVSRAMGELPLQLEDASRNDDELSASDAAAGAVRVNQDVRLNNRVIDLRTPANQVAPDHPAS